MTESEIPDNVFPTAEEDVSASELALDTAQTRSPSYRLAYTDQDFLLRDELRPVRLQLELLKPELLQQENGIHDPAESVRAGFIENESTDDRAQSATDSG